MAGSVSLSDASDARVSENFVACGKSNDFLDCNAELLPLDLIVFRK